MGKGKKKRVKKDAKIRIAIVNPDKCKPKKCKQECKRMCPVVRMGACLCDCMMYDMMYDVCMMYDV